MSADPLHSSSLPSDSLSSAGEPKSYYSYYSNHEREDTSISPLADLLEKRSVIICAGPGGVGKTTVSAAFALAAAWLGKRACVVTIDPAKRLANSLGLSELDNTPHQVSGPWPGELWAMMLDTKRTFDELVVRYAPSPEQAESILSNRVYKNLTDALSGTQEYMAAEKLYELHNDDRFDLLVVDTPPTRNALDFLDAPGRLTRFLENRIFRILLMPTKAYLKTLSFATQALLRTISKVTGGEIVEEAIAFFQAFEGMEEGFRLRAQHVDQLLNDPKTAFVLVSSPQQEAIDEAIYFATKLDASRLKPAALILNRLYPRFGEVASLNGVQLQGDLKGFKQNLDDMRSIAVMEDNNLSSLLLSLTDVPVVRMYLLSSDVHDLDGLTTIANWMLGIDQSQQS